jgi:putative membrane protein
MPITKIRVTKLIILGLLLGAAGLVPGFSSGTLAFIAGLYTLLIGSFANLIKKPTEKDTWIQFIVLLASMVIGAWLISNPINLLLENFEYPLMWTFIGFILASILPIQLSLKPYKNDKKSSQRSLLISLFVVIIVVTLQILLSGEVDEPVVQDGGGFVFTLSALFAAVAGLLPGISGSVVWIAFGQYDRYVVAISSIILSDLFLYAVGTLIGYILFSLIINYWIEKYPFYSLSLLLGLSISSIAWIFTFDANWSLLDWMFQAILPMILGYFFVYIIYRRFMVRRA